MQNRDLQFQDIYADYQPKIQRYLTHLVGAGEAEDLTQEVFIKVNRALENFRGESKLSTWLYRVATNTAFDKLRRAASRQSVQQKSFDDMAELLYLIPSIEQRLIWKEMRECLWNFVTRLPENFRAVILLSESEGLSNRELAETLGVTLDTVKIRLHRARAILKSELETRCSLYRDELAGFACELRSPEELLGTN